MSSWRPDGRASPFKPVTVHTLSEQAAEHLRHAIQTDLLAPGAPLVERELAAQLGMSRVPIREAIQRLTEERLVVKTANRGARVYLPSPEEIQEIISLRIVLEEFVAARVVERWTPENEAMLCSIVDQMRVAVEDRDRPALAQLAAEFHESTWRMAEHTVLREVVAGLRQRVARLLNETLTLIDDEALTSVVESHERLVDVFRRGDVARAQAEIREHIRASQDRILEVLQKRGLR